MSVELIGVLTLVIGVGCFFLGLTIASYAFLLSTLLGAAAAVILTGLGGANVQPAHLLLAFIAATVLRDADLTRAAVSSVVFPKPGFWLGLTVVYALFSAVLAPRLFANWTYVYTIARADVSSAIPLTPLGPVSGNLTQSVYFVGDFICYLCFFAFARGRDGYVMLARAVLACAGLNLIFGALDLATYFTGTSELLAPLRNASYRMLNDAEALGFKRMVGSFPEASAYAYATLGLFAFSFNLWLRALFPAVSLTLAGLSLVALVFSTSTTAYVGLAVYLGLLYAGCLVRAMIGRSGPRLGAFVVLAPLCLISISLLLLLNDAAAALIQEIVDKLILNKLSTQSGVERSAWNEQAMRNFVETWGFGAGIGSVRASSFLIAVPASIGVIGTLTYGIFIGQVVLGRVQAGEDSTVTTIRAAAGSACLALVIAASMAGSFIDLGLTFFVFAALAAGDPAEVKAGAAVASRAGRSRSPMGQRTMPVVSAGS